MGRAVCNGFATQARRYLTPSSEGEPTSIYDVVLVSRYKSEENCNLLDQTHGLLGRRPRTEQWTANGPTGSVVFTWSILGSFSPPYFVGTSHEVVLCSFTCCCWFRNLCHACTKYSWYPYPDPAPAGSLSPVPSKVCGVRIPAPIPVRS